MMSATSAPEKAGLAATSSPSTMSSPMASPTSPAPRAAAIRPSTSRPNEVLGPSTAQSGFRLDHSTMAAATSSAMGTPVNVVTASAPACSQCARSPRPRRPAAWTCPPMSAASLASRTE